MTKSNATSSFHYLLTSALAVALSAAPTIASAASVRPQNSFISANLPGDVSRRSGVRDTVVGDITHHTVAGEDGDAEMSLTATKLPGFVTAVTTDGMLLKKARGELLKNYNASRKRWVKCSFRGYECRKLSYTTSDGRRGKARLFLKGDVMVVVNVVYNSDAKKAKSFLKSVS